MTGATWARRLLGVLACWLAVCVAAAVLGSTPVYGLLALVLLAGAAVLLLFLDGSADAEPARWSLPGAESARSPGEDPRLALLRRVLDGHLDAHEVDGTLHRHLAAIADQRLLARHGVRREADPERAAALMGPELAAFVAATDPHRRLDTRRIDVLIDRIEAL